MATSTTNLNLSKPAYTDPADIAVINDNMDKLDGAVNGVEDGLAIVANGNTHAAVAAGQFVYVRNHSSLAQGVYKATTAIAANGALSTSNLTADASGGLNALKADIDTLNSKIGGVTTSNYAQETKIASTTTSVEANSDSPAISVDASKPGYAIVGILGVTPGNTYMSIQSFRKSTGNNIDVIVHNWMSSARNAQPEIVCVYLKNV